MAEIDQQAFENKYRPGVTEEDFALKFGPKGSTPSGAIDLSGVDAFTGMTPDEVDHSLKSFHRNYVEKGPFTGEVSDQLFNQGPIGRIMGAFGHGFKDGWDGTGPSSYRTELEKEAKEHDANILTGIRNAAAKPAAAVIDVLSKTPFGVMSGIAGATEQTAAEIAKPGQAMYDDPDSTILGKALGAPLQAGAELISGAAHGAFMEGGLEGHTRSVDHVQQVLEARSKGVVGEGEAGYFKVKEVTPEDIEARMAAAHDAGLPPIPPEGPHVVPTLDELAAQMAPDTFKELNGLTDVQENLRNSRDSLMAQFKEPTDPQYIYKDQQRIQKQLEDIPSRLQKIDEQLRDLIPDVNSARERADELLRSDSREGEAYRNLIQAQAFERALALQGTKVKAEEVLRLANDLKEVNAPPIPKVDTSKSGKTNPIIDTKADKPPEVKVSPEAVSGSPPLRAIKGTGEKTPLSLNQRLELDAVVKGWKSEMGDVPQEEILKTEQQLIEAQRLADESLPLATRIAMGDAEVPIEYNVHPEAVLRLLKKRAEDTGDVALGLKLADTRLAGEARIMGQRINLLRNLYEIDPVGIIQDLNKTIAKAGAKKIKRVIDEIEEEVQKAIETFAPDMEAFLDSIKCDE